MNRRQAKPCALTEPVNCPTLIPEERMSLRNRARIDRTASLPRKPSANNGADPAFPRLPQYKFPFFEPANDWNDLN
jgi:hypothetical protein